MFNDGRIKRQLEDDSIVWLGQQKKKWKVIDDMKRYWADMGKALDTNE